MPSMPSLVPYPLAFLLLLLQLPLLTNAQRYSNISLGSSLTARNDNSYWSSPSGDFAFGFQQIEDDGFLLAIWFNKVPERTIVWSANGNTLAPGGSKVQLSANGQLILTDPSGQQIWNSNSALTGVSYAAMLDTGNFVLASSDAGSLWESFSQPTDTMLPTQILNQNGQLIARYSEKNYSAGRFKFMLQSDGNLILYTVTYPLETPDNPTSAYWSTGTSDGSGYQVIFNQSGFIYLTARNGAILNRVLSNAASAQDFYQRATMDSDGVFRHYVYPKNISSSGNSWPGRWTTSSSFIPENVCYRIGNTGGGFCGFNSYCRVGDDQRPTCWCPPGYAFIDPNDLSKGCTQNFSLQSCDPSVQEINHFVLMEMLNTDWPLSDYEHFNPVDEDWCRNACLGDCHCDVAIFRNENCWKKKMPLSNGRMDTSAGGKALIKVGKDNSTLPPVAGSKKKDQSTLILTGSVLLGGSVFLNLLLLIATTRLFFCSKSHERKMIDPFPGFPAMSPRSFTYNELEEATGGFKDELGSGAFGTVYKGVLESENNRLVAVKKLDKMVTEGEREFKTEVSVIAGTNHRNLVRLEGFCNEGQHRLLVYEYMSNGSLADFLFGESRPNWYQRKQIAFGIARGICYLHEECSSQIIHCDIKPQNILLDESLTARISDFGLAKLLKTDQTRTTTAVRGTKGYVAPEWFKNVPVTVKVDVYSFGILLLELICCRKNVKLDLKEENLTILSDWAYDCYKDRMVHLLVEEDGDATDDLKRVEKFVMIAIWCIQEDPSLRPTMKKVMHMLEGAVQVSIPPDPASFISTTTSI